MGERDELYDKIFDKIRETYGPKILAKLTEIQAACEAEGLGTRDPADMCDDEYRWSLVVARPETDGYDEGFSVDIEIAEQREHDGPEMENGEPAYGLNFSITITQFDGTILGGVTPWNYTPFVWVDARVEDAVEDRWNEVALLDDFPIPTLIKEA